MAAAAADACCDRCAEPCSVYADLQQALFLAAIRRSDAAQQVIQRVHVGLAVQEDPKLTAIATLVNARIALTAGDLAAAAAGAETGLHLANETGLSAWAPLGNLVMATTALRRGELSTTLHYANQLKEDAVFGRKMFPVGPTAWILVQITEAKNGPRPAAVLARELLESESATRSLLSADPAGMPWLVRLLVSLGQRDLADQGVRFANALAAENPDVRSMGAAAMHAAGLLEEDPSLVRRAADDHTDPWARASAFEDIGALLFEGSEERQEAAEHLELAMRRYAEMGALRDASRVRSRLRRINADLPSQLRFWPHSRIPDLTDTEYAVAKLVSEGLTNGQVGKQMFLSRHTVAFHLRKIFPKLGVKSRLEMALMWNELNIDDGQTLATPWPAGRPSPPAQNGDPTPSRMPRPDAA
jgi:ATP/maltotriose-dependent transcriptional regulator MalT